MSFAQYANSTGTCSVPIKLRLIRPRMLHQLFIHLCNMQRICRFKYTVNTSFRSKAFDIHAFGIGREEAVAEVDSLFYGDVKDGLVGGRGAFVDPVSDLESMNKLISRRSRSCCRWDELSLLGLCEVGSQGGNAYSTKSS